MHAHEPNPNDNPEPMVYGYIMPRTIFFILLLQIRTVTLDGFKLLINIIPGT